MRVAVLIASVLLASTAWPQNTELIPKAYLAPKYVAPADAPSNTVIAGRDERGDRLIVTGRALDQGRPVAGVSIYAFHADADGLYSRDGRNSDENARLFATLRTDGEGRYRYETIRPGNYPRFPPVPAHVHYVVRAPGYKPIMFELWFEDDPALAERRKVGMPDVPTVYPPDAVAIRPVTRDAGGVWHSTRDLTMVRE